MDVDNNFLIVAKQAKAASKKLAIISAEEKNLALKNIAENLEKHKQQVFNANLQDLEEAKQLLNSGEISQSVYNRLKLDENKMRDMIQGIYDVISLEDPIGKILLKRSLMKIFLIKM